VRTPVDLDAHATTPLDPRVREAMLSVLDGRVGNPASDHALGWAAAALLERAREQVAALVHADPSEVIFTSGATEACNQALLGLAELHAEPRHLLISNLEHPAVLRPAQALAARGWSVEEVPCDGEGLVDPAAVAARLRPETALVSLIGAQNEVGTVQPWREAAAVCRERGVPLHVDGAQAVGRVPVDFRDDGLGLLSLSAHKFHGPAGSGALVVRRRDPRVRPAARILGGGQEDGRRSGTPNLAGVVGLGEAARLAAAEMDARAERLRRLGSELYLRLAGAIPELRLNGSARHRLPGSLSLTFPGVKAADLLRRAPTLALSTGAACGSGSAEVSRILTALGLGPDAAASTLRIGLHKDVTDAEAAHAAERLAAAYRELRG